jgi:crotonobetainyl-CoA:carnitine CoA-transferase CaiB-like acyl-CoA transferase
MLPFEGLRIVDCSLGGAGPRASGIFADYGADVIWVEPPGGDPNRQRDPTTSAIANRGKRSVTLDVTTPAERERILQLAERADIFMEGWRPGEADRLGLGFQTLRGRNPQLIYCSISGYGADDPLRDLPARDALIHALFGATAQQLGHREGPIFQALPLASCGAALLAVLGVLTALYRRIEDGVGRKVETSLLDGLLTFNSMQWNESDASLAEARTKPSIGSKVLLRQSTLRMVTRSFICSDGTYLGVHTGAVGAFDRLMKLLGLDEGISPAERGGNDLATLLTQEEADFLEDRIHRTFAERPREDWLRRLIAADVCAIEHMPPTQVFDHRQARHNGMVISLEDPVLGTVEQVAPGLRFDGKAPKVRGPAPIAGQHTDEVLASLETPSTPSRWREDRGPGRLLRRTLCVTAAGGPRR